MVQYSIKVIVTVCLNHPEGHALVNHSELCTVHDLVQRQDECHMSAAHSQHLCRSGSLQMLSSQAGS